MAYVGLPHVDALTRVVIRMSSAFIFQTFAEVCYLSSWSIHISRVCWRSTINLCLLNLPKRSTPWVKFYLGLSLHIFQHGSSLSLENVCDSWCMHAWMKPSCLARRPLCHKVNLPRCEARRRYFIMTCDIFGTGQTNILARGTQRLFSIKYLFGEANLDWNFLLLEVG